MGGSMLLVAVWAYYLAAFASAARSSVELGAPDECARCLAENARLTSRIDELAVRAGQLEAELAAQRGDGQGAREGSVHAWMGFRSLPDNEIEHEHGCQVPRTLTQRVELCRAGDASMSKLAISLPALPTRHHGTQRARQGSRRKSSIGTHVPFMLTLAMCPLS